MSRYVFKLPDLGEGTVEAEIVGWRVKPGDSVAEDDVIVEVMTDKAAVEVPAPVSGRVLSVTGGPGDKVPVGAELIVFETEAQATSPPETSAPVQSQTETQPPSIPAGGGNNGRGNGHATGESPARGRQEPPSPIHAQRESERMGRIATSPAIRRRAHEAGVDLGQLVGSGPNGRILREDLEAFVAHRVGSGSAGPHASVQRGRARDIDSRGDAARGKDTANDTEEIKVIGIRRVIAQRMSESKRNIPHFAYVEELDVTELESLRRHLNGKRETGEAALTYLPFLVMALVRVLRDFPQCNALYDSERGVIVRHHAVHVGIATQTPDGLKVPVVRHAQSLGLWELAAEMRRVTEAARTNKASRDILSGSTITVTSLGKLGGIATTPIINAPEVAIVGVNRAIERPVVVGGAIAIRLMMNLSSSFDHRFVDGYDAAAMIQALKERLEHPATVFMDR